MSKDTIYREDAILAMANALWHYPNDCYKNLNVYEFAKALAELGLRSLPSAQPERKKGKWEITNLGAVGTFASCSECKRVVKHKAPFYNYCPHCGADMRGKAEE